MRVLWLLISVSCYYLAHTTAPKPIDDTICTRGPCNEGYVNKAGKAVKFWGCGKNCPGGAHRVDADCSCACISPQECQDECKHKKGMCNAGMWDTTDGNWRWNPCGTECTPSYRVSSSFWSSTCVCACQDKPDVCPDSTKCYGQVFCDDGYKDKTDWGKAGPLYFGQCGRLCKGGRSYYTTDIIHPICNSPNNCACVPEAQCALAPGYPNFNLYRYAPQLAFVRIFGVWGEYVAIALIIGLICLLLYKGYKKYKTRGKKMYYGKIMEDESDVEENEKDPIIMENELDVEENESDPINNAF